MSEVAPRCSVWKGVFSNIAKFTKKHLYQSVFLIKLQAKALKKKRLWHRCFPVNFTKFQRTPFLQNTFERDCFCNVEETEPFYLRLTGGAGVGKSFLINFIT